MHDKRNLALIVLLAASVVWLLIGLTLVEGETAWFHRFIPLGFILVTGGWLIFAFTREDRMPDHLGEMFGSGVYYEADGLSFMVTVRQQGHEAQLSVHYQNRFENPTHGIIHLRPPENSFCIRPGWRDVHFAFRCDGGAFGVIHQPIAIPRELQGEVLNVQLAAASWYPRGQGSCVRRTPGMACGTLLVDWGGAAFRTGVHEVSGEIPLQNAVTLHLSMPMGVAEALDETHEGWVQQQLEAGVS